MIRCFWRIIPNIESKMVQEKKKKQLDWPHQSSNVNQIEHLQKKLKVHQQDPQDLQDSKSVCVEGWATIVNKIKVFFFIQEPGNNSFFSNY